MGLENLKSIFAEGVGTYTPVITKNTGQGPGEYFQKGSDLGLRLGENTTWSTLYTRPHKKTNQF